MIENVTEMGFGRDADGRCFCHGKTDEEIVRPYALFVFGVFVVVPIVALLTLWVTR